MNCPLRKLLFRMGRLACVGFLTVVSVSIAAAQTDEIRDALPRDVLLYVESDQVGSDIAQFFRCSEKLGLFKKVSNWIPSWESFPDEEFALGAGFFNTRLTADEIDADAAKNDPQLLVDQWGETFPGKGFYTLMVEKGEMVSAFGFDASQFDWAAELKAQQEELDENPTDSFQHLGLKIETIESTGLFYFAKDDWLYGAFSKSMAMRVAEAVQNKANGRTLADKRLFRRVINQAPKQSSMRAFFNVSPLLELTTERAFKGKAKVQESTTLGIGLFLQLDAEDEDEPVSFRIVRAVETPLNVQDMFLKELSPITGEIDLPFPSDTKWLYRFNDTTGKFIETIGSKLSTAERRFDLSMDPESCRELPRLQTETLTMTPSQKTIFAGGNRQIGNKGWDYIGVFSRPDELPEWKLGKFGKKKKSLKEVAISNYSMRRIEDGWDDYSSSQMNMDGLLLNFFEYADSEGVRDSRAKNIATMNENSERRPLAFDLKWMQNQIDKSDDRELLILEASHYGSPRPSYIFPELGSAYAMQASVDNMDGMFNSSAASKATMMEKNGFTKYTPITDFWFRLRFQALSAMGRTFNFDCPDRQPCWYGFHYRRKGIGIWEIDGAIRYTKE